MCVRIPNTVQVGDTLNIYFHPGVTLISVDAPNGDHRILRGPDDNKLIITPDVTAPSALNTIQRLVADLHLEMAPKDEHGWTERYRMYTLHGVSS